MSSFVLRVRPSALCLMALILTTTAQSLADPTLPATSVALSPLDKCLKRAEDLPDMAAADAGAWIKRGGGNDAHLCRAFAQAHRGMHADAAREFWSLASFYAKQDKGRSVPMYNLSGQEFLRAKDNRDAEAQFSSALKIAPYNAESLIGRAEVRMAAERYWDALDDLNRVIKEDPKNAGALRQRGRAWTQLGNDRNAEEDFGHAEDLDPVPPQ